MMELYWGSRQRVSFGNFVVNKNIKKTFPVTDHVGAGCTGMVADMQVSCKAGGGIGQNPQVGDVA